MGYWKMVLVDVAIYLSTSIDSILTASLGLVKWNLSSVQEIFIKFPFSLILGIPILAFGFWESTHYQLVSIVILYSFPRGLVRYSYH
eukprot:snap_masked-scaffold_55-processed-gene-0.28-mRNA-1 protein AED:1.00 eAED:1.00 QI:0/-1/0/0/-1/1/1/0/86